MGEKCLEEGCVNDERKTKKELIAELEELRRDNAELRQHREGEVGMTP